MIEMQKGETWEPFSRSRGGAEEKLLEFATSGGFKLNWSLRRGGKKSQRKIREEDVIKADQQSMRKDGPKRGQTER